jgi:hypothetical protein
MVHKSTIIPGLSQFIDTTVLSHYPPTSMKRILAAGAIALYLQQNTNVVDTILNNSMVATLGVSTPDGMVDICKLRDVYKAEISKVGFMRISIPLLGDVDFTTEDLDTLYNIITSLDKTTSASNPPLYNSNTLQ